MGRFCPLQNSSAAMNSMTFLSMWETGIRKVLQVGTGGSGWVWHTADPSASLPSTSTAGEKSRSKAEESMTQVNGFRGGPDKELGQAGFPWAPGKAYLEEMHLFQEKPPFSLYFSKLAQAQVRCVLPLVWSISSQQWYKISIHTQVEQMFRNAPLAQPLWASQHMDSDSAISSHSSICAEFSESFKLTGKEALPPTPYSATKPASKLTSKFWWQCFYNVSHFHLDQ